MQRLNGRKKDSGRKLPWPQCGLLRMDGIAAGLLAGIFHFTGNEISVSHLQQRSFLHPIIHKSRKICQSQPMGTDHQIPTTPTAGMAESR